MKLNTKGRDLIQEFEGLELTSYQDEAGVWTIGIGHTKGVGEGDEITLEQAFDWLDDDIKVSEKAVNKRVKVQITQNQFDALVSFVFNLGEEAFRTSTMLRWLNKGDILGVPQQLVRFNRTKGKRTRGLVRRRLAEANLWITQ